MFECEWDLIVEEEVINAMLTMAIMAGRMMKKVKGRALIRVLKVSMV